MNKNHLILIFLRQKWPSSVKKLNAIDSEIDEGKKMIDRFAIWVDLQQTSDRFIKTLQITLARRWTN